MKLLWAKGGEAALVSLVGDAIVLRSTTPAPPGARLEATFDGRRVKVKSHGTHKEPDGSFTLKGRLLDANRDLLDALQGARGARPAEPLEWDGSAAIKVRDGEDGEDG